jgi:hypothetical protein
MKRKIAGFDRFTLIFIGIKGIINMAIKSAGACPPFVWRGGLVRRSFNEGGLFGGLLSFFNSLIR